MATEVALVPLRLADDCSFCAHRLREGIASHRGVVAVGAAPGLDAVRVTYDPRLCSASCLERATEELRAGLESTYAHEAWRIEGMDCGQCARTIESAVGRLDGVTHVAASFPAAQLRVEREPNRIEARTILEAVAKLGYRAGGVDTKESRWGRWVLTRDQVTAVAVAFLLAGLVVDLATGVMAVPLYGLAVLVAGLPLARSGVAALIATRRPEIKLLMMLASVGAVAIGAWLEAALVVVLFSIGEALEGRAVERARGELAQLVGLASHTARVLRRRGEGPLALVDEVEVAIAEVAVGETVVVRPGERIPVDGVVRAGASAVDQAAITGESTPVDKEPGDITFAGTLNGQGQLQLEVTSAPGDTTLDRISELVADAQAQRSPSERWVDGFARWYTPLVVAIAILVAALPPLWGVAFATSFYDALALLILACPCALVISTPVAIVSALARASSAGVLVKGGAHLEQAASISVVAFDKTGTLTLGLPAVTAVEPDGRADEVLRLAGSLEHASEHPLARAIVLAAEASGLARAPVEQFVALTGLGAHGIVEGERITIGNERLLPNDLPGPLADRLHALREQGQTVVLVLRGAEPLGLIGLTDTIRPQARDAVDALRRLRITVAMLTGDNAATAAAVATATGVDLTRANLLPQDKVQALDELGECTAMVGDGVNDAPALAAASLGIAMGSAGSDTAIEVADVAIMGDDPRSVAGLIGLARWTKSVVHQNIAFSLATKLAAAGLLAAAMLPLWGAVVADVGASLIVVANGLRLLRNTPIGRMRRLPLLQPRPNGRNG